MHSAGPGRTGLPQELRIFGLLGLLFLIPTLLFSIGEEDPRIDSIHVEGLRRTREAVVLELIDTEPGDSINSTEAEKIEARLVKTGIFASVEVSLLSPEAGSTDLLIRVEEKWTLIPIPFFSSDGTEFSGGLILLESNLFGRNKRLISAGFGGTEGVSGFFVYADPSLFGSSWSASVSAAAGTGEVETLTGDETRVRAYSLTQQSAGIGIGYRLSPELRIASRLGFTAWEIADFVAGIDPQAPEEGSYLEPQISVEYDNTRPLDVLLVGPEARLAARWVTLEEGSEISGRAVWGIPLPAESRVRLIGSGGYGSMPVIAESPISSRDGYRTLPYQATRADRYGSAAVFYDLPVLSADWGALVLSHFWEGGLYETEILEAQGFYGPGGGFRVYIRRIALPALGLDIAYNLADSQLVFSFAVGMRM